MKLTPELLDKIKAATETIVPGAQSAYGDGKYSAFRNSLFGWSREEILSIEAVMYIGRGDEPPEAFDQMLEHLSNIHPKTDWAISQMCEKSPLKQYLQDGIKLVEEVLNPHGLKRCPFCGKMPKLQNDPVDVYINCCFGTIVALQKSDHLEMDDRDKWDDKKPGYPDDVDEKVIKVAVDMWNTRAE